MFQFGSLKILIPFPVFQKKYSSTSVRFPGFNMTSFSIDHNQPQTRNFYFHNKHNNNSHQIFNFYDNYEPIGPIGGKFRDNIFKDGGRERNARKGSGGCNIERCRKTTN